MRRYVLTSLAIGGSVIVVVLVLFLLGVFEAPAKWLGEIYLSRGIFETETFVRAKWLEILLLCLVALGISWAVVDVSQFAQKILVAMTVSLLIFALSPTLALYNVLYEPFSALAGLILASGAALIFSGTERGMRKRMLEDVLGLRVSRDTFDELLSADDPPDFGGEEKEVTVLTCRLFNHEELKGKMESVDLMGMSNLFIRNVSTFLLSRGAYLDESGPELVRVFFGLIGEEADHADKACKAALELRSRLKNLSQECETRWFQRLYYGVGINSGKMTVGVYGSQQHQFFSGIGPDTDYSRRLAHANHRYGSDLLVGPDTYRIVSESYEFRPMEMFYDPEAQMMTEIYQLLADKGALSGDDDSRREHFWKGVVYFREKKYEEALDSFAKARQPGVDDDPLSFFVTKAQEGIAAPDSQEGRNLSDLTEKGHARLSTLM